MGGILKNPLPKDKIIKKNDNESVSEFRKQVFKNTQLNAKLTARKDIGTLNQPFQSNKLDSDGTSIIESESDVPLARRSFDGPPKDVLQMKQEEDERLQWNKKNLEDNEITKQQFQDIHVDEPKTPYQGAVDPAGEYYRVDDEDDENNDIPELPNDGDLDNFTLGEPEFDIKDTSNQQEIDVPMEDENNQESDEEVEKEARHRKFEEMRKKHYDLREIFKSKKLHPDEIDDDNEDNDST